MDPLVSNGSVQNYGWGGQVKMMRDISFTVPRLLMAIFNVYGTLKLLHCV